MNGTMNKSSLYNVPAEESQPKSWSHINGSTEEILARYCITEICQGWPVYRDASEWNNYRSIWTDDAVVFTTWSGGLQIDDFIEISKKGRANGDFIMHRVNGTLAEVNLDNGRALGRMKATITQRVVVKGITVDVECDCRFIFFCKKMGSEWKAQWMKIFYEKDKLVPVNGKDVPHFDEEELQQYTEGYRYLSACQATLGHKIMNGLPNASNEGYYKLNDAMQKWMEGEKVELRGWEKY